MAVESAVQKTPSNELAEKAMATLLTPEGEVDPYPHFDRMREAAPVFTSAFGICFLTSYDACQEMLLSQDFGAVGAAWWDANNPWWRESPLFTGLWSTFPGIDPPDHTRLRSLVSRVFTQRRVEELRPFSERLTAELLDAMADQGGTADLMESLALPMPISVIGELLGVPTADRKRFRQWIEDAEVVYEVAPTPEAVAKGDIAWNEMGDYFAELVADFRRHPQENLTSALIHVRDGDGDRLSEEELMRMLVFLFAAGFETTTGLIGNAVAAIDEHPAQAAVLCGDPAAVPRAVEEVGRYDAPVQMTRRVAARDTSIGGVGIPAGMSVIALLGAANRDPARFPDPDRLDLGRDDARPLSFGGGIHHCLGAVLGRMEVGVALRMLYQRFPGLRVAGDPVRSPGLAARRHITVPVAVRG
jgi:cytochrome P450